MPLISVAAMMASVEPMPEPTPDSVKGVFSAAEFKINEAFKKGGSSTCKALEAGFIAL